MVVLTFCIDNKAGVDYGKKVGSQYAWTVTAAQAGVQKSMKTLASESSLSLTWCETEKTKEPTSDFVDELRHILKIKGESIRWN